MIKPALPKGTRDFSPDVMRKRNYIFSVIREAFRKFSFLPIETPAMENLSTLTGKYGEEGDQLIFKILNSGAYLKEVKQKGNLLPDEKNMLPLISEKALRYDLTVPFARYVVMNRNDITFPFKRYQIQPVWRADKPQKGRYREFYQCDADIIGSGSLLNEVELVMLFDEVFRHLGMKVKVKVNNRKILAGIAAYAGNEKGLNDLATAIDKLEKTGEQSVLQELSVKGFTDGMLEKIKPILQIQAMPVLNDDAIRWLSGLCDNNEMALAGLTELSFIFETVKKLSPLFATMEFDITLARGLNYYTGSIFEVKADEPGSTFAGSICGGGRYDDLTGIFGMAGVSGVGISFGADRIYDVMEELKLFEAVLPSGTEVLVTHMGEETLMDSLKLINVLRNAGFSALMFPDATKLKKQFAYADALKIPVVCMIGENEKTEETISVKWMKTGVQQKMSVQQLLTQLKSVPYA